MPSESAGGQALPTTGQVIGRDKEFAVVIAQSGDTLASLAQGYLGDGRRAWWIGEFNNVTQARPGQELVIPLKARNPLGVYHQGFQTVPILCYHRFSNNRGKLAVTPAAFEVQMEFLARNNYRVISFSQLQGFLQGREPLPRQAVVITIDDGYRSTYEIAYPVLRKHGFPATVFLYSDFVGATDALTWPQMQEIARSGLIEIQPHSKTHSNLALRLPQESESQYRDRMRREVDVPSITIEERLATKVNTFAYPYGDTNEVVMDQLVHRGIALGATVTPGGNAFFAYPHMLRRTMVFGDDDLAAFAAKLTVFTKSTPR
jgi:peptidoglycan/xylan/chitin deacetylase (PgdA/CDA1 family)